MTRKIAVAPDPPLSSACSTLATQGFLSMTAKPFTDLIQTGANLHLWDLLNRLRNGEAIPGVVRDDTKVFVAAGDKKLSVVFFDVILPDPRFHAFQGTLDRELNRSQYTYGFPNGSGDCNCTTWLERIGLPLLTGRMDEFTSLGGIVSHPSRKFGDCV
jgi:hypothetical protein